ncbi:hypothetical protein OSTOST_17743 [Ostertagia ostertagi]
MPLSTAASSMKSTKWVDDGEESECEAVPLPIQTFLWRQTNPFLGAKVGKLHEASCVVSGVSLRLSTVGIPFIHF